MNSAAVNDTLRVDLAELPGSFGWDNNAVLTMTCPRTFDLSVLDLDTASNGFSGARDSSSGFGELPPEYREACVSAVHNLWSATIAPAGELSGHATLMTGRLPVSIADHGKRPTACRRFPYTGGRSSG